MNKWIEELSKCTCWYPDMKAREKLTCECEECDHECHSKKFAAVHEIVQACHTYGYSRETKEAILDCLTMSSDNSIENAYILNKKLVVENLLLSIRETPPTKCRHRDRGLLKTQGYYGPPPDLERSSWKPHTTTYPIKPTPDTVRLPLPTPRTEMTRQLHDEAQRNAERVWKAQGITKYVDFESGVAPGDAYEKVELPYDRDIVVFPQRRSHVKCPNVFGEYFHFYDGADLARGPYRTSFEYRSKTSAGDYKNIDEQSHTNTYRSDCSLWYAYQQKKYGDLADKAWGSRGRRNVVKEWRRELRGLKLAPPRTDEERFEMWSAVVGEREAEIPSLSLMTI